MNCLKLGARLGSGAGVPACHRPATVPVAGFSRILACRMTVQRIGFSRPARLPNPIILPSIILPLASRPGPLAPLQRAEHRQALWPLFFMENDVLRIPALAARQRICPRLMNQVVRQRPEFRHPTSDKLALRIKLHALRNRIKDAEIRRGVGPGAGTPLPTPCCPRRVNHAETNE